MSILYSSNADFTLSLVAVLRSVTDTDFVVFALADGTPYVRHFLGKKSGYGCDFSSDHMVNYVSFGELYT